MSDDIITIEVNGEPVEARKGQMIIEVTDAMQDAYVPRFCYHSKLSVAANCRMCLVEVEKAPKPLPACATPVMDGMKVFTRSEPAIAAQRATMEFLLINHPLDCPICDQGGECELQDLAMGYGRDVSRYNEGKRSVKDMDLGPLVSTDMTRCIHCTRCVRFGQEIAGIQELGTTGRGEHMEIGTWIERSVDHELSGNIIDLCPVGALNNKPYRYKARTWEMTQHATVSPHDCVGANLYAHVRRGEVMRVVPRPNEDVNETWIADRDRFSCHGLYADDRIDRPMVKVDGTWQDATWEEALARAAEGIRAVVDGAGADRLGVLVSPTSTTEEHFLAARLARSLGCANVDHRLQRMDFSAQDADPVMPSLGLDLADVEGLDGLLVVGGNLRSEAPLLAHRVRKAALAGARVALVNSAPSRVFFPLHEEIVAADDVLTDELLAILAAALDARAATATEALAAPVAKAEVEDRHRRAADALIGQERSAVLLGLAAGRHQDFSRLRAIAAELARTTGATLSFVTEGGNSAGAYLAGAVSHRDAAGTAVERPGLHAAAMLKNPLDAYLLLGLEAEHDSALGIKALATLEAAGFVVALTTFASDAMRSYADVLLPVGAFAETSGTFVNGEGRWQSFAAAAPPLGEARPAWKVLRVLAEQLGLEGFDYDTSEAIRDALRERVNGAARDNHVAVDAWPTGGGDHPAGSSAGIYSVDPLVRRSLPLQLTSAAADEGAL